MKKLLLVCCIALGVTTLSRAQGGGGGQGRGARTPEAQTAQLKTQLTLTDDQAAKVLVIYQGQTKSMDSLRTAAGGDMQSMFTKMAPITNATNAKIKAILTADQATAFQKQIDERAARMKQMMGGGGAPPQR